MRHERVTVAALMNASQEIFRRHRLSVEEYRRMGEHGIIAPDARVELIDGEIIEMVPIGPAHAGIVDHLTRLLVRAVEDDAIVRVQNPMELSNRSQPQPDLQLLIPRDDYYKRAQPRPKDVLLSIEVADSSLAYDRDVKLSLYARHGIVECWLVDVTGMRITRCHGAGRDGYARQEPVADLHAVAPLALPDARMDLYTLF